MMSGAWGLKPGMMSESVGGEMNLMIVSMAEAGGFDWGAGGRGDETWDDEHEYGRWHGWYGSWKSHNRWRWCKSQYSPRDGPVTQMGGPGVLIGPQRTGGQPNILACSSKNATSLPLSRKEAIVVCKTERPS